MIDNDIDKLYNSYAKTAENIILYFEGDARKEMLKTLREIVEESCVQHTKLKLAEQIPEQLAKDSNEKAIDAAIKEYTKAVNDIQVDVTNNKRLLEYDQQVEVLLQNVLSAEDVEGNTDEDLLLTRKEMNVIDPISKQRIKDPVKNILCGHTYDRDTVAALIKLNDKTRCPVAGCKSTEFIRLKQLRPDIVMKLYLDRNFT